MAMALITTLSISAQVPNQSTQRQIRTVLNRLVTKTAAFQREVDRNRYPQNNRNADERMSGLVTEFSNSVNSLRSSVNGGGDSSDEITTLLGQASRINAVINRNAGTPTVATQWNSIRTDVNTLSGYYNIAWNWNEPYPNNGNNNNGNNNGFPGGRESRLTGTYRLNTAQSDDVNAAIDRSVGAYNTTQRDGARRGLERRLRSPEMIAIDKSGRSITMASSNQPQVTFDADGIKRTETDPRGRNVTTTVTATNNTMTIAYEGDRTNDFNVTFTADRNGRLKVTRRIFLEGRSDTITVSSVYDRVDDVAQWSTVNTGSSNGPVVGNNQGTGDFYIPNGVALTATLRSAVSTQASQTGDRFTMDVSIPSAYRGAVIDGHVEKAANSGRINGRASLSLVFDSITYNGRRYSFAGIIESVTAANGDTVTVNNEGTVRDSNQGTKTATRAGIGAVLGAIIGAVAGGGSGAAIGAGVGAGAGVGSVLVTGRDKIDLGAGSTFRITSTAPANVGYNRN